VKDVQMYGYGTYIKLDVILEAKWFLTRVTVLQQASVFRRFVQYDGCQDSKWCFKANRCYLQRRCPSWKLISSSAARNGQSRIRNLTCVPRELREWRANLMHYLADLIVLNSRYRNDRFMIFILLGTTLCNPALTKLVLMINANGPIQITQK